MKHPAIWAPINIGDWTTATQGLSAEEKGAVIELLLYYWDRGEWPSDQAILAMLGISARKWLSMQEPVGGAMTQFLDRSGFVQKRERAHEITKIRRGAANNRWDRYRKNATQGLDANAYANAMQAHMRNQKEREEPYKGRSEKPTEDKGLGEKDVGQETDADRRPNGKLWH
jgi:uncharacterized protein YdaU (DUF1376 family)